MTTDMAIETEMTTADITAYDIAVLASMIADDAKPAKRGPKVKVDLAGMSREEQLAHKAEVRRRNYTKKQAMMAAGSLKYDEPTARAALADAALMILAHDLPGAELIMNYLGKVYHDKGCVPFAIKTNAKKGKYKPKLLQFSQKAT